MNIAGKVSLKIKIMGAVLVPILLLVPAMLTLYLQGTGQLKGERNRAINTANTIAFDSVIASQAKHLEKMLTNVLMIMELVDYTIDPENKTARMVLEGQFLSLVEEGIIRFSIYNKEKNVIFQQVKGVSKRKKALPGTYIDTFTAAAKDAAFHLYFRGSESGMREIGAEYCILSSIIDDDDATIGYVELAAAPGRWVQRIAELTQARVFLYDPAHHALPVSESPELAQRLLSQLPKNLHNLHFIQTSFGRPALSGQHPSDQGSVQQGLQLSSSGPKRHSPGTGRAKTPNLWTDYLPEYPYLFTDPCLLDGQQGHHQPYQHTYRFCHHLGHRRCFILFADASLRRNQNPGKFPQCHGHPYSQPG